MGFSDVAKAYKPVENSEFGPKKKMIGDAVCTAVLENVVSKKNGKNWTMLKLTAIHPIPDPKGRDTTIASGDEVAFFYDGEDAESVQKLLNDLFTAGIEFEKDGTEEQVVEAMTAAVNGKLVYVRTWAKSKNEEQLEKYGSDPDYFQNQKILSASKITSENSQPVMPF